MEGAKVSACLTKKQNYRLWQGGEFGNKLRAWRTVREWRDGGFVGSVVLRTLLPWGSGPVCYNLRPEDVDGVVREWLSLGIPIDAIMVNEAAPNASVVLQGEYLNDVFSQGKDATWAYFYCSRARKQMRDALFEQSEVVVGWRADEMLRREMTPSSYEDWQLLLDRYPGHVLEVSIYGHCLGDIPGRNALVWEVRRY